MTATLTISHYTKSDPARRARILQTESVRCKRAAQTESVRCERAAQDKFIIIIALLEIRKVSAVKSKNFPRCAPTQQA